MKSTRSVDCRAATADADKDPKGFLPGSTSRSSAYRQANCCAAVQANSLRFICNARALKRRFE